MLLELLWLLVWNMPYEGINTFAISTFNAWLLRCIIDYYIILRYYDADPYENYWL